VRGWLGRAAKAGKARGVERARPKDPAVRAVPPGLAGNKYDDRSWSGQPPVP
jgi:hypothetical protein